VNDTATTILMPLKNYHPSYLAECLDSVLGQTSPLWYLQIIVEPKDLAAFRGILENYLSDPRIQIIANQGRKLSGAFNTGMRRAATPFVGILLSDDMWSPEAVHVLNEHQQQFPQVDFFHSSRIIVDGNGRPLSGICRSSKSFKQEEFLYRSPVKHLLCWRAEKALSFGGMDESLNSVGPDDYDFPWLMAEHGATFMAVDDCLYVYRDHRESYRLTTHIPRNVHARELERILRKHRVKESDIRKAVARARRSYLRQCLYRWEFERWLREWTGWRPRGWRQPYSRRSQHVAGREESNP
jgi:glycosyltransferase involved in cell wall biosynthesis